MTNKNVEKRYTDPVTGKFIKGNPGGGRPKGSGLSITSEIKRKLQEIPEGKEKTYLHYLIEKIMKKAIIDEDQQTIKQIWNYIDGLPRGSLELSGNRENPLIIKIQNYGDLPSSQLETRETPTADTSEQSEIQSDSLASESSENDLGS